MNTKNSIKILLVSFAFSSLHAHEDIHISHTHALLSSLSVGFTLGAGTAAFTNFFTVADGSEIFAMSCAALSQTAFLMGQLRILRQLPDSDKMDHAEEILNALKRNTSHIFTAAFCGSLTPLAYKYTCDPEALSGYDYIVPASALTFYAVKKSAYYIQQQLHKK